MLPPSVVDGRCRNPLYYYYFSLARSRSLSLSRLLALPLSSLSLSLSRTPSPPPLSFSLHLYISPPPPPHLSLALSISLALPLSLPIVSLLSLPLSPYPLLCLPPFSLSSPLYPPSLFPSLHPPLSLSLCCCYCFYGWQADQTSQAVIKINHCRRTQLFRNVVAVVAFSSRAKIMGESSTNIFTTGTFVR